QESESLGVFPLVDEAVKETGAYLGIVVAVGHLHPYRVLLLRIGQQVIRFLAEEPGPHAHDRYRLSPADEPADALDEPRRLLDVGEVAGPGDRFEARAGDGGAKGVAIVCRRDEAIVGAPQ